jgi:hypothetical protein
MPFCDTWPGRPESWAVLYFWPYKPQSCEKKILLAHHQINDAEERNVFFGWGHVWRTRKLDLTMSAVRGTSHLHKPGGGGTDA